MKRTGAAPIMWIAVLTVILLILAAVLIAAVTGNLSTFDRIIRGHISSADLNTCETQVNNFCTEQGSGADWGAAHPNCDQYKDAIDSSSPPDTLCD